MASSYQLDKYHINNVQGEELFGRRLSGFALEDQQPVSCLLLDDSLLTPEQLDDLQRSIFLNHVRELAAGRRRTA